MNLPEHCYGRRARINTIPILSNWWSLMVIPKTNNRLICMLIILRRLFRKHLKRRLLKRCINIKSKLRIKIKMLNSIMNLSKDPRVCSCLIQENLFGFRKHHKRINMYLKLGFPTATMKIPKPEGYSSIFRLLLFPNLNPSA